eukprot:TRINITY_DN32353_c0_g1_i1.p1 TRINITY_DN32353_c0_g1~~TRINITY_DN32353_c0_g1_i1.p1  ORF type:complete len:259 (-),score=53.60 TRINITY_DN32353_c0_g1_i1:12-788(-)
MMPAVVLISGMSGAGKSTLAELLRERYGLIHFDADCWTVGRDPVAEAGATIKPEDFEAAAEKVPEITKLRMEYKEELTKVFQGGMADAGPVERFYSPMVAKVQEVRVANPGKGIVMSRAVFFRIERDVLRKLFGDDFVCVVLCLSGQLLANRRLERAKREAAEGGKTLEEHVMGYPSAMIPGETAEQKLAFLGNPQFNAKDGEADEPNTFNLRMTEETSKDTMLSEAAALLQLSRESWLGTQLCQRLSVLLCCQVRPP